MEWVDSHSIVYVWLIFSVHRFLWPPWMHRLRPWLSLNPNPLHPHPSSIPLHSPPYSPLYPHWTPKHTNSIQALDQTSRRSKRKRFRRKWERQKRKVRVGGRGWNVELCEQQCGEGERGGKLWIEMEFWIQFRCLEHGGIEAPSSLIFLKFMHCLSHFHKWMYCLSYMYCCDHCGMEKTLQLFDCKLCKFMWTVWSV